MSTTGQEETLGSSPYYYAYADCRFCEVTDESNGYREFAHLTIFNSTDRCARLTTVMSQNELMDELTGLDTKQCYFDWLEKQYSIWVQDNEVKSISVVVFDVDGFRRNIYSIGHANGDAFLVAMAELLIRALQPYRAKPIRLGGDDFATVIVNADKEVLLEMIRAIQESVERLDVDVSRLEGVVPGGNYKDILTLSAAIAHMGSPLLCDLTKITDNCLAAIQTAKMLRHANNREMTNLVIEIDIETRET